MAVSYKKLWKLLIDKDMKKKDLCEKAGISPASVTKMGRNGHVTTEILVKICAALDCRIEDIVEIVPDEKQPSNGYFNIIIFPSCIHCPITRKMLQACRYSGIIFLLIAIYHCFSHDPIYIWIFSKGFHHPSPSGIS